MTLIVASKIITQQAGTSPVITRSLPISFWDPSPFKVNFLACASRFSYRLPDTRTRVSARAIKPAARLTPPTNIFEKLPECVCLCNFRAFNAAVLRISESEVAVQTFLRLLLAQDRHVELHDRQISIRFPIRKNIRAPQISLRCS